MSAGCTNDNNFCVGDKRFTHFPRGGSIAPSELVTIVAVDGQYFVAQYSSGRIFIGDDFYSRKLIRPQGCTQDKEKICVGDKVKRKPFIRVNGSAYTVEAYFEVVAASDEFAVIKLADGTYRAMHSSLFEKQK